MFGKHFVLNEQTLQVIEQLGEHMPGGFFIYREDGEEELLYANRAVFEIFGCDSLEEFQALTGYTFRGMLHPDDYEAISASIIEQIQSSKDDLDYVEYRIIRKDGQVRWLDDYGHYVRSDAYGGLYYVFISDITEKRQQMESDRAVRMAVIDALSQAYNTVWLINDVETETFSLFRGDMGSESVHATPIQDALTNMRYSQAKVHYINTTVAEADRERLQEELRLENIVRNTREKGVYAVNFKRTFDEIERYYRIEFVIVEMPNGKTGVVAGFKDVDEEVRKEQEIQQALRDAMHAANASNKAKSDFLSSRATTSAPP